MPRERGAHRCLISRTMARIYGRLGGENCIMTRNFLCTGVWTLIDWLAGSFSSLFFRGPWLSE